MPVFTVGKHRVRMGMAHCPSKRRTQSRMRQNNTHPLKNRLGTQTIKRWFSLERKRCQDQSSILISSSSPGLDDPYEAFLYWLQTYINSCIWHYKAVSFQETYSLVPVFSHLLVYYVQLAHPCTSCTFHCTSQPHPIIYRRVLLKLYFSTTTLKLKSAFWTKSFLQLHRELLEHIFKSTMAFFDTTPLGRIINRFSKDIDDVDSRIPKNITGINKNNLKFKKNTAIKACFSQNSWHSSLAWWEPSLRYAILLQSSWR